MAKSKKELLEEAKKIGVNVTEKNTVAEITAAIAAMSQTPVEPVEKGDLEIAEAGEIVQAEEAGDKKVNTEVAKAGKRSAKALKEIVEKQAKEERKLTGETEQSKPKQPVKPARTRLERRGKKFREIAKLIDKTKVYSTKEAVELALKTSSTKFDATVELAVNLNVDPKQADQNVRGTVLLPAGSGKAVKVAVFSDEKVSGADVSGVEAITKALEKSEVNFDVLISPPANMAKLGKYARLLGPRGLMPNPKSGTVTTDLAKAVNEAKAGKVEYRVDSAGIIHVGVGKASFSAEKLKQNLEAVLTNLKANKPSSIKGDFIKSCFLATTMGPSIKLEVS